MDPTSQEFQPTSNTFGPRNPIDLGSMQLPHPEMKEEDWPYAYIQNHPHKPIQHRDGKEPWCNLCGKTARGDEPKNRFMRSENDPRDFYAWAKRIVVDSFNGSHDIIEAITEESVYVVWFCKTLQNWKALCSTTVADGMYYEVTHDGDKKVTYLDSYKKISNETITESVDRN